MASSMCGGLFNVRRWLLLPLLGDISSGDRAAGFLSDLTVRDILGASEGEAVHENGKRWVPPAFHADKGQAPPP